MSSSMNLSIESSRSGNWHCYIQASIMEGHPNRTLISLSLPITLQRPHLVPSITEFAQETFPTVSFQTQGAGSFHPDVVEKFAKYGDIFISSIQVLDVNESLHLINQLFQKKLMTESDKLNIENSLNELENLITSFSKKASSSTAPKLTDSEKQIHDLFLLSSAHLSGLKGLPARWSNPSIPRVNTISSEKKIFIELSVLNSIGIVKKNIKDVEKLKTLLEHAKILFNNLPHHDLQSLTSWLQFTTRDDLGFSNESNPITPEEEKEFYQNVVQLSLIYYSRANLEETLLKLGAGLPSEEKIQETILNFFENYRVG